MLTTPPAPSHGGLDLFPAPALPPNLRFKINQPVLHILAQTTEARDAEGNVSTGLVSYTKLGWALIRNIMVAEYVVARVETRGVRSAGERAIIDCSDKFSWTTFHEEEQEFKDEE